MTILGHCHVFWSQWKDDKGLKILLDLFVKIPTTEGLRKFRSFFRGFQILCGSRFDNPLATSMLVRALQLAAAAIGLASTLCISKLISEL